VFSPASVSKTEPEESAISSGICAAPFAFAAGEHRCGERRREKTIHRADLSLIETS